MRPLLVALALLAACGGHVETVSDGGPSTSSSSGSSGGGSSSGSEGGSSSGTIGLCPTQPPTPGDSCSSPGEQQCGYLDGPCQLFQCDDSGHWALLPHC
jgi:hypothetical protein